MISDASADPTGPAPSSPSSSSASSAASSSSSSASPTSAYGSSGTPLEARAVSVKPRSIGASADCALPAVS
ncbi:hypothetical protein EB834_13550 [Brevibacterium aurantiacum]|uniref:Uncharacterized protein n=1 Tax=Brevibacterium aurantiacum TaxID=273384 RepID=A0A4Z0KJ27_BREAU|nr:hypothetical protein EB834_13550 [Brevibacterium aurantiacum]